MAKPKHGRSNNHTGLISFPSPSDARPTPLSPAPRRRRFRPPSCCPSRFPSPAVLSALALIATTPPAVAGGPLPLPTPPPTFLCPFIDCDHINTSPRAPDIPPPCVGIPPSPEPFPIPTPSFQPPQPGPVADKYIQGPDNLWRKANTWILYGSTCCSIPTASIQPPPSFSQKPVPVPIPTMGEFDTSALPAGWDGASHVKSTTESTIILTLAIVLAISICVFMIVCIIWRKRKRRTRDMERKLARKLGADNDPQDDTQEKDARGKMRIWVKASARWKSNIRQSARRRRKRPTVSSTADRPKSPASVSSSELPATTPSPSPFTPQKQDPPGLEVVAHLNGDGTERSTVTHDHSRSSSPPTYGASFSAGSSRLPLSAVASNSTLDTLRAGQHDDQHRIVEDELLPYIPPRDGHVATDDKAQLAYIRELGSSPPTMADAATASAAPSGSVPEWHEIEDDLEDLGIDLSEGPSSHESGFPPFFPPPPSKADVPLDYLDDRSFRFGQDDDILVTPVSGLSGFSTETFPSAPPIDDPGLEPSAPSLEGEDDLFQDWDGTSSHLGEACTSADLDSTPIRMTPVSSPVSSTPCASFPSIVTNGVLPRYYP